MTDIPPATTDKVFFGKNGDSAPGLIRYISEVEGLVPWSWWPHDEVGNNDQAKKEIHELFGASNAFDTPKPERLIQRVLHISTSPGDLVLDSFLGSGTTAAVAHKMGRRYIGIEMGDHARTHCLPRLQKVIEGEQGGISASVEWKGGGGFRFCTLGDPAFDTHGRINSEVKFATLAAYVWHFETGQPGSQTFDSPLLGVHDGVAYYLLFNGILGDRKPAGGNVLTHNVLHAIKEVFPHDGPRVVYGEVSRLGSLVAGSTDVSTGNGGAYVVAPRGSEVCVAEVCSLASCGARVGVLLCAVMMCLRWLSFSTPRVPSGFVWRACSVPSYSDAAVQSSNRVNTTHAGNAFGARKARTPGWARAGGNCAIPSSSLARLGARVAHVFVATYTKG